MKFTFRLQDVTSHNGEFFEGESDVENVKEYDWWRQHHKIQRLPLPLPFLHFYMLIIFWCFL